MSSSEYKFFLKAIFKFEIFSPQNGTMNISYPMT